MNTIDNSSRLNDNQTKAPSPEPQKHHSPKEISRETEGPMIQSKTLDEIKQEALELQKLSNLVLGRDLKYSVNKELKQVTISIIDPVTDEVIKQIPSEDIQNMKIRLRKTMGILFDKLI